MSKIKSKKFWISLVGTIVMLLQLFGLKIETPYVGEIVNSICAICVLMGITEGEKSSGDNENEQAETGETDNEDSEKKEG